MNKKINNKCESYRMMVTFDLKDGNILQTRSLNVQCIYFSISIYPLME